ncbi:MAG: hypothetical protein ABSC03_06790 [Verrucomicrobiota bacterium]|jgi:hypothetical protein
MKTASRPGRRFATQALTLDEAEWDFGNSKTLPETEVEACYYYEFAREQFKSSPEWQERAASLERLMKSQSHGGFLEPCRDVWMVFFSVESAPEWQPMSLVLRPDFLTIPWLSRDLNERKAIVARLNEHLRQRQAWDAQNALQIVLERDAKTRYTVFHGSTKEEHCDPVTFASWAESQRDRFDPAWGNLEYGYFAVNWNLNDKRLLAAFATWLKVKRGDRRAREARGSNKKRQHLKALGAKRLLDAGFSAECALEHTQRQRPTAPSGSEPILQNAKSFSKAKLQTVPRVLARLFGPQK